ncbi:MAG: YtxH domain-containing protein [Gemmatimonadales bacterium]
MRNVRDDAPVVVVERSSGGVGAFLFGLLAGAGLALLLAPQSGEETRRKLRQRGKELKEVAEGKVEEWQERLESGYGEARTRVEEGLESAKRAVSDTRRGAKEALDAGRAAVHSARDELDRRLSESRKDREEAPAGVEAEEETTP